MTKICVFCRTSSCYISHSTVLCPVIAVYSNVSHRVMTQASGNKPQTVLGVHQHLNSVMTKHRLSTTQSDKVSSAKCCGKDHRGNAWNLPALHAEVVQLLFSCFRHIRCVFVALLTRIKVPRTMDNDIWRQLSVTFEWKTFWFWIMVIAQS